MVSNSIADYKFLKLKAIVGRENCAVGFDEETDGQQVLAAAAW